MQKRAKTIFQSLSRSRLTQLLLSATALVILVYVVFILLNKPKAIGLEPLQVAREANNQCGNDPSGRCFQNFFSNFAIKNEFTVTKSVLDELVKINNTTKYCHNIAHAISIAEVEKDPENWLKVFSYVPDSQCSYGFFHGVIEGKYQSEPGLVVGQELIRSVCTQQLALLNSIRPQRSCTHAFGHVVLVQREGDVEMALDVCRGLPPEIKNSCYQGIFMEHIQKDNLSEHGIEERVKWDERYLAAQQDYCNDFTGGERVECWRSLGPLIVAVTGSNYEDGINKCRESGLYQPERACVREVLGKILVNLFSKDRQPAKDFCGNFLLHQRNTLERVSAGMKLVPAKAGLAEGESKKIPRASARGASSNTEYSNCLKDIIGYVLLTSADFKSQMQDYCSFLNETNMQLCRQEINTVLGDD